MKTKNALITIVVLLVLGILAVLVMDFTETKTTQTIGNTATSSVVAQGSQCFYLETIADSGLSDIWAIRFVFNEDSVTGDLVVAPADMDSARGVLHGVAFNAPGGYIVNAQYDFRIEGSTAADQRIIRVTNDGAFIGFCEREEGPNGILQFKDIANLTYMGPIPSVDCAMMPE